MVFFHTGIHKTLQLFAKLMLQYSQAEGKFHQFGIVKGEFTMEFEGYCVKCRKKQKITNGTAKETSNGRRMVQGTCPVCKTKVTRFLPAKKPG
jgi:hypothetical protein